MTHVMVTDSDSTRPPRQFGIRLDAVESIQPNKTRKSLTVRTRSGARHSIDAASGRMLMDRLGYRPDQIERMLPRETEGMPSPATNHAGDPVVTLPPATCSGCGLHFVQDPSSLPRFCLTCARAIRAQTYDPLADTQTIPCDESARTNAGLVYDLLKLAEA